MEEKKKNKEWTCVGTDSDFDVAHARRGIIMDAGIHAKIRLRNDGFSVVVPADKAKEARKALKG